MIKFSEYLKEASNEKSETKQQQVVKDEDEPKVKPRTVGTIHGLAFHNPDEL